MSSRDEMSSDDGFDQLLQELEKISEANHNVLCFRLQALNTDTLRKLVLRSNNSTLLQQVSQILPPEEMDVFARRPGMKHEEHTRKFFGAGASKSILTRELFEASKYDWYIRRHFARFGPLEIVRELLGDPDSIDVRQTAFCRLAPSEQRDMLEAGCDFLDDFLDLFCIMHPISMVSAPLAPKLDKEKQVQWAKEVSEIELRKAEDLHPEAQVTRASRLYAEENQNLRDQNTQLKERVLQLEALLAEQPGSDDGTGAAILEGAVGAVASRLFGEKAKLLTDTGRGAALQEVLERL